MFRTGQTRPVSGASYTPGPWCSHDRHVDSDHHCRLPAAGPVPRSHIPSAAVPSDEAYRGSLTFALSGLSLACNRWMEHQSLGFLPGFTPRRYQRRMPGAGTSRRALTRDQPPRMRSSNRLIHSTTATSRRTPVAFRLPALASWTSFPAEELKPLLRSAYQTEVTSFADAAGWTPARFPLSAHSRFDRIGCPLYPETYAVLLQPTRSIRLPRAPSSKGQVLPPRSYNPSSGARNDEVSSRVHLRSPAQSSPGL
jgi:hypothetical protein